ncbi:DUF6600 domain-containing protein [Flavobacterium sp. 83]|uniref:DUF6600 domain-containing protein n=1 Tax=Flavobacterium sp. 83 TaxID=1131812 RepID=UPI00068C2C23|nr:DUF6600 domain-containing protein [Flavobacterium sp. 83]
MKTTYKIFVLFLAVNSITLIAPQKASAQISINFQVFYDDLSPYGNWINNRDYGYVWVPDVSNNFSPYNTNGYWVYTNVGWTWVSNYSWGWAPFHYGRWLYDSYYGWLWVPGYEWGPGWVTWRSANGYYGWAPIGPGISIEIAYGRNYNLPYNQWTFVRDRDFGRRNIYNYYVNSTNNTTIIYNSTVINNIQQDRSRNVRYNAGPDRTEVQRRTGTAISPITLRERNKPGQNLSKGELQIYRPIVQKNNATGHRPVPSKVANIKELKPISKREAKTQPQNTTKPTTKQPNNKQAQQQQQQQAQQQRNNQQIKQQQAQQQRNNQQAKQQQAQQQRNDQQINQQQAQQQRNDQQVKQQQAQQQRNDQQVKQQQAQQQRNDQQVKQQQAQQQRNDQQVKQQQAQQQLNNQQVKQQRNDQQVKQQQAQQQRNDQQVKQQQAQQQRNDQQVKQQQPINQKPENKQDKHQP